MTPGLVRFGQSQGPSQESDEDMRLRPAYWISWTVESEPTFSPW